MAKTVQIQELCPTGFGASELKGYGYIGSIYKFEVRYTYPSHNEDFNPASLIFEYALAYKWTGQPAATPDMLNAYDTVVEVQDSQWLREIKSITRSAPEHLGKTSPSELNLRHYMVYFDDNGCLEVIAESVEFIKGQSQPSQGSQLT